MGNILLVWRTLLGLVQWLAARLKEPSTWRGVIWLLIALLTALGIAMDPEKIQAIIVAGTALAR